MAERRRDAGNRPPESGEGIGPLAHVSVARDRPLVLTWPERVGIFSLWVGGMRAGEWAETTSA